MFENSFGTLPDMGTSAAHILADNVARLMAHKGLTLPALGEGGVPPSTIDRIRRCEGNARITHLPLLAELLGVRLPDLFTEGFAEDLIERGVASSDPLLRLDPSERELVTAYRDFPDEDRTELLRNVAAKHDRYKEAVKRALERRGIDTQEPPTEGPAPGGYRLPKPTAGGGGRPTKKKKFSGE